MMSFPWVSLVCGEIGSPVLKVVGLHGAIELPGPVPPDTVSSLSAEMVVQKPAQVVQQGNVVVGPIVGFEQPDDLPQVRDDAFRIGIQQGDEALFQAGAVKVAHELAVYGRERP